MKKKSADVCIWDEGTIVQFVLLTSKARKWVSENVEAESWQFLGNSLCVDHRYSMDVIDGMQNDGLMVELHL